MYPARPSAIVSLVRAQRAHHGKDKMPTVGDMLGADQKRRMIAEHAGSLDFADFEEAMSEGGIETADGCWVELDGSCPHGFPSPMRYLGMI